MTEKRRESFIQGNLEYCFTKKIEDGCRVEKLKPAHFSLKVSSPWKMVPHLNFSHLRFPGGSISRFPVYHNLSEVLESPAFSQHVPCSYFNSVVPKIIDHRPMCLDFISISTGQEC